MVSEILVFWVLLWFVGSIVRHLVRVSLFRNFGIFEKLVGNFEKFAKFRKNRNFRKQKLSMSCLEGSLFQISQKAKSVLKKS